MKNLSANALSGLIAAVLCLSAPPSAMSGQGPATAVAPAPAPAASTSATVPPPSAAPVLSAADLEKLAMPIALHPDTLIAIILPAAAYPLEIVQAARFIKNTNNIPKIDAQTWDENVKAVAKFPDLISKMDADLSWTMELGQAFVDHPKELMDVIQSLRGKALKAGTLQTTAQQVVNVTNVVVVQTNVTQVTTVTNQIVQVVPSNPAVVYVPTYASTVYYPPPAYVYDPVAPLVTFGVGMAMGAIIANNCDWHHGGVYVGHHGGVWVGGGHGDVDIDVDRNVNINNNQRTTQQPANRSGTAQQQPAQQKWQPDQTRRAANVPASVQTRESRGWSGSGASASTRPAQPSNNFGQRPTAGTQPARPSAGQGAAAAQRPTASTRPATTPSASSRPSPTQTPSRSSASSTSAFSGVNSGSGARVQSSRGATSRGSASGGMSRGGGGGGARGGGGGRR